MSDLEERDDAAQAGNDLRDATGSIEQDRPIETGSQGREEAPKTAAGDAADAGSALKTDTIAAVDFLQQFRPGGPWLLCAFHESRPEMPAREFGPDEVEAMVRWIEEWNAAEFNVYFHVNSTRPRLSKKAEKADVVSIDWFHVDVDPEDGKDLNEERARILKDLREDFASMGLQRPSAIVFSGGGYQAFWRLDTPIEVRGDIKAIEQAERYNRQIEGLLGADNCHNADRIMRVPGTTNWPNAKKRKRGQEPELAEVVEFEDAAYELSKFVQAVDRQERGASIGGGMNRPTVELPSGNVKRIPPEFLLDALKHYGISDEDNIGRVIRDGEDTEAPPVPGADRSRSGWFLHAVCELVRHNVPDELIYAIVTDPAYDISQHPIGQGRGRDRAVKRALVKAKESVESDDLAMLNDGYAFIESVGGRARIMCERANEASGRREIEFLLPDGFKMMWNNRKVILVVGKDEKGNNKYDEVPLGKFWLGHKHRRTYRGVTFWPGREFEQELNLWRGFNVDAVPGDCDLFLAHVRDNICRGNEEHYDYLLHWMANAVQDPGQPGQVAIVLRGGQGTGKGVFAHTLGHLFGIHYKHVVNPDHIMGQFNSTLRDAALVFADECFVAGDRRQESALKTLITEDRLRTEAKGLDSVETRNCVHLIMATNQDWSISVDWDDRRFFALNVGDDRKQDTAYFRAIHEQMKAGGYEALMHRLLTMDLRDFNVRQCPKTDELRRQQVNSLDGTLEGEWLECLIRGELPTGDIDARGFVTIETGKLLAAWELRIGNKAAKANALRALLHAPQGNHVKDDEDDEGNTGMGFKRVTTSPRGYVIPPLAEARRRYDERRWRIQWDDGDKWAVVEIDGQRQRSVIVRAEREGEAF